MSAGTAVGPAAPRTLGVRLRATFALLLVQLVLVGTAGVGSVVLTNLQLEDLAHRIDPAIEANGDVLRSMLDAQTGSRGYLITGLEPFLAPWDRARGQLPGRVAELRRLVAGQNSLATLVAAQEATVDLWWSMVTSPDDSRPVSAELDQRLEKQRFDAVREANAAVHDELATQRADLTRRADLRERVLVAGLVVTTALTFVIGLVISARTAHWVVAPAVRLRRVVERQRLGQHAVRADLTRGPAEVVGVARAVNALAEESHRLRLAQSEAGRLRQLAHEVSRAVRDTRHGDAGLPAALALLGSGLGVDHAWYRPLDDDPAGVVTWARQGLESRDDAPVPHADPVAVARLLAGQGRVQVVAHVLSSDLMNHTAGRAFAAATDAGSVLVAPVEGGDDVIGVLALVTRHAPREYSDEEVAAVRSVARDVAQGLQEANRWATQRSLVDRLQDLDRQKSDFLSTVSHELRTPLTSIAGYLELIDDGEAGSVPPGMRPMLDVVGRSTSRLQSLIEDLLTLSRIESGAFRTSVGDVEVSRLVRLVGDAVRPQADRGGLGLSVVLPAGPLVVRGDEMQLERVLLNLASNAVKFTPPGGSVTMSVGSDVDASGRAWAVVTVRDTGIGIPQAEQASLFSRFFRASNATAAAVPGTGLGLTIVRSVVDHHGGALKLESSQGEGTTVTVRLPGADRGPAGA